MFYSQSNHVAMVKNVMTAVLVATLVGGFVAVIVIFGLLRAFRHRRRREIAELAYIKSSANWRNASSFSVASPQEPPPAMFRKQISEPMLLKDFEGRGVALPPHISEMLNVHSKLSCPALLPMTFSPDTSRQLPYGPELDMTDKQSASRVPMLLRQPRRKSNPQQRHESILSVVSAESMYSTASAPSHIHHMFSAENWNVPPATSLTPSVPDEEDFELISLRKTENRGSSYWTLDPSSVTRVSASVGDFTKVRGSVYNQMFNALKNFRRPPRSSIIYTSHLPAFRFGVEQASNYLVHWFSTTHSAQEYLRLCRRDHHYVANLSLIY